jgi:hypothetical protein
MRVYRIPSRDFLLVCGQYVGFIPEGGVGLVPKRGCLLTLAYYAFPRWYEFGELQWNDTLTAENRRTQRRTCPSATSSTTIPHGLTRARTKYVGYIKPDRNAVSSTEVRLHSNEKEIVCEWCIGKDLETAVTYFNASFLRSSGKEAGLSPSHCTCIY